MLITSFSLAQKIYAAVDYDGKEETKMAHKGISKHTNKLRYDQFKKNFVRWYDVLGGKCYLQGPRRHDGDTENTKTWLGECEFQIVHIRRLCHHSTVQETEIRLGKNISRHHKCSFENIVHLVNINDIFFVKKMLKIENFSYNTEKLGLLLEPGKVPTLSAKELDAIGSHNKGKLSHLIE